MAARTHPQDTGGAVFHDLAAMSEVAAIIRRGIERHKNQRPTGDDRREAS